MILEELKKYYALKEEIRRPPISSAESNKLIQRGRDEASTKTEELIQRGRDEARRSFMKKIEGGN